MSSSESYRGLVCSALAAVALAIGTLDHPRAFAQVEEGSIRCDQPRLVNAIDSEDLLHQFRGCFAGDTRGPKMSSGGFRQKPIVADATQPSSSRPSSKDCPIALPSRIRHELPKNTISTGFPVEFGFNSDALSPAAKKSLENVAIFAARVPGIRITLVGHADIKGSNAVNDSLSQRRAEGAKQHVLASMGAAAGIVREQGRTPVSAEDIRKNIEAKGVGNRELLPDHSPCAAAQRRIELQISRIGQTS